MNVFQALHAFQYSLAKEPKLAEVLGQALAYLSSEKANYVDFNDFTFCPFALKNCALVITQRYADPSSPAKCFLQTAIKIGGGASGMVYVALEVDLRLISRQKPHPYGLSSWSTSKGLMPSGEGQISFNKIYKMKRAEFTPYVEENDDEKYVIIEDSRQSKKPENQPNQQLKKPEDPLYQPNYMALGFFSGEIPFVANIKNAEGRIYESSRLELFFTPFFGGIPLTNHIENKTSLSFLQLVLIMLRITYIILIANLNKLMVRDIKPDNILLDRLNCKVRLIDQESMRTQASIPQSDRGSLTSFYAAPETGESDHGSTEEGYMRVLSGHLEQMENISPDDAPFWGCVSRHFERVIELNITFQNQIAALSDVTFKSEVYSLGITFLQLWFGEEFIQDVDANMWSNYHINNVDMIFDSYDKKNLFNQVRLSFILNKKKTIGSTDFYQYKLLALLYSMLHIKPNNRVAITHVFQRLTLLYHQLSNIPLEAQLRRGFFDQIPVYQSGLPLLEVAYLP